MVFIGVPGTARVDLPKMPLLDALKVADDRGDQSTISHHNSQPLLAGRRGI